MRIVILEGSSVVQHIFTMLLHVLESLQDMTSFVESGEYSKQESFTRIGVPFHELHGMRMGIIGVGTIGRRVAEVATAFGMEVVYYSASGQQYEVPYKVMDFDTLMRT